ncbi:MAG: hypothetical protein AB7W59_27190 [Acidimicrobiia bacterium]
MTSNEKRPRVPAGMGPAGAKLWRSIVEAGDLDARSLALLGEACRIADLVAVLDAQVAADGAMVKGSNGQPRAHPALAESRHQRASMQRLLGALTQAVDERPLTAAQQRARRAAAARWAGNRLSDRRAQLEAAVQAEVEASREDDQVVSRLAARRRRLTGS